MSQAQGSDGSKDAKKDFAVATNRKALHDYFVLDRIEAGIALVGTEVKAARTGSIELRDAYVDFKNGEAFLVGARISPYSHGNRENHLPDRERKLLLSRREIDKLAGRVVTKGLSVVPLQVYLRGSRIKVEIGLRYGLEDCVQAHRDLEAGKSIGSSVFVL